jgi:antirestriction protein ArdC
VDTLQPKIRWGGAEASYNVRSDLIHMPDRGRFYTEAGRYSVLMHEIGHWTGHKKRLNRDLTGDKRIPDYWREELVAELTACFVLARLDLPDHLEELPDSAAYLKHYLGLLKGDRRTFIKAASLAQKASDYILSGGEVPAESMRRNRRRGEVDSQPAREEVHQP